MDFELRHGGRLLEPRECNPDCLALGAFQDEQDASRGRCGVVATRSGKPAELRRASPRAGDAYSEQVQNRVPPPPRSRGILNS